MTSTRTSYMRPLAVLVALVAAMAALLIAYNASPARAAGECSTNAAGTTTCTYASTGAEDTFVVPDGVSTIHVVATGAPGAVGSEGGPAGSGAQVSGDLTVTPGDTLYVEVGGAPTGAGSADCYPTHPDPLAVDCIGGFNGGGSSYFGGGGGGASDVRTVARAESASLASRLIVAAGGGGSGLGGTCQVLGGSGGNAGSDGGNGGTCGSLTGGTGGEAGTQSAGGAGGSPLGGSGSLGLGGTGGGPGNSWTGGAGGSGYYGGGGGGDITFDDEDRVSPAGGGGGGSNLVPTGGTASVPLATTGPSVTISYTVPTPAPTTKEDCKKGGFRDFGFPDQGTCITAFNENRL